MSKFGEKKFIHRSRKLRKSQMDNTVNLMQTINKEKIYLKSSHRKIYTIFRGMNIITKPDFQLDMIADRRQWNYILKVLQKI